MNNEQIRKVEDAIKDCDRIIAKEQSKSADLRPVKAQQILDHAIAHRAKLIDSLETGVFPTNSY